jgi:F-type H+-transporting ATPase subunit alpha
MEIRTEDIAADIRRAFERYRSQVKAESTGRVVQVGDAVARIWGLDDAMMGEVVKFHHDLFGLVLNLEEDSVGAVVLGAENPDQEIKEGDLVTRTGQVMRVAVGDELLGRVVNIAGQPLDGGSPISFAKTRPLEAPGPSVLDREPVTEPLPTGIKAIDSMIPIGRGQRELIIGDRQTGKSAIAVDAIINQKGKDVLCVYVAIGQRVSTVVALYETLKKYGAMDYTVIVNSSARTSAAVQYLAPYTGCAIAEEWMYSGRHALVVYDDLSKHAQAYRQISLLLRRPPGREAYPGDVFYLHSRLLERAAKLSKKSGGGSMTAIPIVETQAGDISSYIPTNVISITDGQIYLESDLFYAGIRPAVNVGLSVSRVGGKAQDKAMRQVAAQLRLDLAQYRELAGFTQFGSELDKATQAQLTRGERMVEILRQDQLSPLPLSKQVAIIYAGSQGALDGFPRDSVRAFEAAFLSFLETKHPALLTSIDQERALSPALLERLDAVIADFVKDFERKESAG